MTNPKLAGKSGIELSWSDFEKELRNKRVTAGIVQVNGD